MNICSFLSFNNKEVADEVSHFAVFRIRNERIQLETHYETDNQTTNLFDLSFPSSWSRLACRDDNFVNFYFPSTPNLLWAYYLTYVLHL